MVVKCDIQLAQNSNAIYYAGQVVMGKITLTADKTKQAEAVNLKINGWAKTKWKKNKHSKNSSLIYQGEEEYINIVTCLLAPNATDQAVVIEPGIHTFNFVCHLPANCPSSFEGEYGSIRYILQIELVRPWKFNQTFTKAFTVLAIKDLNVDSYMLETPGNTNIIKSFCCGPIKTQPLQINAQLPQTGFVPGQCIPISIWVVNDSSAHVHEFYIRLVMTIIFFSTQQLEYSKTVTKTIAEITGEGVKKNCQKNFNFSLPIPATTPTDKLLCKIIQITYAIELEFKIEGLLYKNQFMQIPVVIGNVPLYKNGLIIQEQPKLGALKLPEEIFTKETLENKNKLYSINENIEPWSAVANLSAPVYMKADHMPIAKLSEEYAHDYGEQEFTPKYPVFSIPSSNILQPINGDEIDGFVNNVMTEDPDSTTWL